jgi:hypothetical protein
VVVNLEVQVVEVDQGILIHSQVGLERLVKEMLVVMVIVIVTYTWFLEVAVEPVLLVETLVDNQVAVAVTV